MFTDKSRQYPHLTQYLNVASRQRTANAVPVSSADALAIGSCAISGVLLALMNPLFAPIPIVGAFLYWTQREGRSRDKEKMSEGERRRLEARPVVESLQSMIANRRLHRDLDTASLLVLEECARHWSRARATLASPFWTSPDLPVHYRTARETALGAVEGAMDEAMLLYRDYVPEQVGRRPAMDYVEEALEDFVFKGPRAAAPVPGALEPARQIAEKLRTLAAEAERAAQEAGNAIPQAAPGSALDLSLGELRTIRQAEDELRQNLRG